MLPSLIAFLNLPSGLPKNSCTITPSKIAPPMTRLGKLRQFNLESTCFGVSHTYCYPESMSNTVSKNGFIPATSLYPSHRLLLLLLQVILRRRRTTAGRRMALLLVEGVPPTTVLRRR